jgi:hypothetical protein
MTTDNTTTAPTMHPSGYISALAANALSIGKDCSADIAANSAGANVVPIYTGPAIEQALQKRERLRAERDELASVLRDLLTADRNVGAAFRAQNVMRAEAALDALSAAAGKGRAMLLGQPAAGASK